MMVRKQGQAPVVMPVHLRPDKGNWSLVALFGIIGLALPPLMLQGKRPLSAADWEMVVLFGAMFLIPTLLFGVWQARAEVSADADGLRWRGLGGWRESGWPDVTDYYEQLMANSKPSVIIETDAGRLRLSSSLWTATSELRKLIEQKATQARTREWGILGMRPETDWPRVFDYNTVDNRILFTMPGVTIALLGYMLWIAIPSIIRTAFTLGWGWAWASAGMLLFGLLPTTIICGLTVSVILAMARRRGQSITLRREGLTFEDKGRRIEARWEDISDLYLPPRRGWNMVPVYAVVTRQGTFDFAPSVKECSVLSRALTKFAVALPEPKWRSSETDALGEPASRWTSRCEGVGRRVYHYRTRLLRALLWFPTALLLALTALHWWLAPLGLVHTNIEGLLGLGALTLWGWWRYAAARIETDDSGITQRTLLGARHLAWDAVEDYGLSGGDAFVFGVVRGGRTRLWFWIGIADGEELKAAIQRQARNSRRQSWQEQEETKS